MIPFLFLLPSTITELSLKCCTFEEGHSLHAMLHRDCVLQCLNLRCVSMGVHVGVCCFFFFFALSIVHSVSLQHAYRGGMSLSHPLPLIMLHLDFNIGSGPMTTSAERRAVSACDVHNLLQHVIPHVSAVSSSTLTMLDITLCSSEWVLLSLLFWHVSATLDTLMLHSRESIAIYVCDS